ncbi:MAG: VirB3 family type IV secretion system protein [Coxiellaceae bacterium]|nr:VirB3 family type IV secretion system protein [Coxiellaceae bacterium]
MQQAPLTISPLFVGLTRPAMIGGVSMEYLGVSAMVCLCGYILFFSPLFLVLYIPLHLFGVILSAIDHHIFRLLIKKTECPPVRNKSLWRCQCYEPY